MHRSSVNKLPIWILFPKQLQKSNFNEALLVWHQKQPSGIVPLFELLTMVQLCQDSACSVVFVSLIFLSATLRLTLAKQISEHSDYNQMWLFQFFCSFLYCLYALNTIFEPLVTLSLQLVKKKTPQINKILPANWPQSTVLASCGA